MPPPLPCYATERGGRLAAPVSRCPARAQPRCNIGPRLVPTRFRRPNYWAEANASDWDHEYAGVTAARQQGGASTTRFGTDADAELDAHLATAAHTEAERRGAGGLLVVTAHRQGIQEFAAHARMLALSNSTSQLEDLTLLILCNNPSTSQSVLTDALALYVPPVRLRLLVHTAVNAGFSCGELQGLAASIRIWRHFPWVILNSGPDSLPTPFLLSTVGQLLSVAMKWPAQLSFLADPFPSHWWLPAFSMDFLVFVPSKVLTRRALPHAPAFKSAQQRNEWHCSWHPTRQAGDPRQRRDVERPSVWHHLAAACIRGNLAHLTFDMPPETLLGFVEPLFNLSFLSIGGRGSQRSSHRLDADKPSGSLWHVHNMSKASTWLERQNESSAAKCCWGRTKQHVEPQPAWQRLKSMVPDLTDEHEVSPKGGSPPGASVKRQKRAGS